MAQKTKESPSQKARRIDQWTETLFKALSSRVAKRWRFASFRGAGGGDWCGVVDVLAIRKDTATPGDPRLKRGDLFEMILVQMKGGSARMPSDLDKVRLQRVRRFYGAKEVVLFKWNHAARSCTFSTLEGTKWKASSAAKIFG